MKVAPTPEEKIKEEIRWEWRVSDDVGKRFPSSIFPSTLSWSFYAKTLGALEKRSFGSREIAREKKPATTLGGRSSSYIHSWRTIAMDKQNTLFEDLRDGILTLTINRPEALNCFDMPLLEVFGSVLTDIAFDRQIRVVIITGSTEGKNAFSTGADLKERVGMTPDQVRLYIQTIRNLFTAVEELPKPVIAAVNGYAFGGGLELALACDIRLASTNAQVGLTETSLAVIPGAGGTQRLPRVVGLARAKEMILRARRITAAEGLDIGLFLEVVEPERLLPRAREIAQEISANGPVALAQAKYAVNKGIEVSLPMGLAIESNAYVVTIPTRDRTEGLTAFREKRKPVYTGE